MIYDKYKMLAKAILRQWIKDRCPDIDADILYTTLGLLSIDERRMVLKTAMAWHPEQLDYWMQLYREFV